MLLLELHRVKNLSSNFEQEVGIIGDEYIKARYPFRFINSVIDSFNQEKEDRLIPTSLFEERKEVRLQIHFGNETETRILALLTNWKHLPIIKIKFRYFWKTRKVRSYFVLKDPVIH